MLCNNPLLNEAAVARGVLGSNPLCCNVFKSASQSHDTSCDITFAPLLQDLNPIDTSICPREQQLDTCRRSVFQHC